MNLHANGQELKAKSKIHEHLILNIRELKAIKRNEKSTLQHNLQR